MNSSGSSPQTYIAMILVAAALTAISCHVQPVATGGPDFGLCLPSPDRWPLSPLWSGLINGVVLLCCSLWAWFLNKRYNFVRSADYTLPSLLLLFTASNPLSASGLNTSTLLLVFWLMAFSVLFGCYRARNASQQIFIVASFLGIGTMVDYAFLVAVPMVIVAAFMLKVVGWREMAAFVMGLLAPFWIALGFGWLSPAGFHWPAFAALEGGRLLPGEWLAMAVQLGLLWLCAVLCGLNTVVKLYAGNPKPRTFNYIIYIMGLYFPICILFDGSHMSAYLASLYFSMAVMFANFFALKNVYRVSLWIWVLAALAVAGWAWILF